MSSFNQRLITRHTSKMVFRWYLKVVNMKLTSQTLTLCINQSATVLKFMLPCCHRWQLKHIYIHHEHKLIRE